MHCCQARCQEEEKKKKKKVLQEEEKRKRGVTEGAQAATLPRALG
jgi:hypothetical protein